MGHDIFIESGIFRPTFHTYFMYAFYLTYYVSVAKSLTMSDLNLRLQAVAFLGFGLEVIKFYTFFDEDAILVGIIF